MAFSSSWFVTVRFEVVENQRNPARPRRLGVFHWTTPPTAGSRRVRRRSTMAEQLFRCETDVPGDLPEQDGREVAALVERNGGRPAVGVPELLVRAALSGLLEPESAKDGHDLARLEDRKPGHR